MPLNFICACKLLKQIGWDHYKGLIKELISNKYSIYIPAQIYLKLIYNFLYLKKFKFIFS